VANAYQPQLILIVGIYMNAVILVKYVMAIAALLTYSAVTLALPNCQGKHLSVLSYGTCYGSHTFINGDRYIGEFGSMIGMVNGVYTFASGKIFKGQRRWFHGKPHNGQLIWENGDVYYGSVYTKTNREMAFETGAAFGPDDAALHVWPSGEGVFIPKRGKAQVGRFKSSVHPPRSEKGILESSRLITIPPEETPVFDSQFPICGSRAVISDKDPCYALEFIPNVGRYLGEFKQNDRCAFNCRFMGTGKGKLSFFNGDNYTGDFWNGVRHGKGTFTKLNGVRYIGDWSNDVWHGTGVWTYPEGVSKTPGFEYSGYFKNGSRDGVGTLKFVNGAVYVGDFKEDKRNGIGVNVSENGEIQAGIFENEVLTHSGENRPRCPSEGIWDNCISVAVYNNGDKYSGYWKTDLRHGLGIYTWQGGQQYVGNWKAHKKSGKGTQTLVNGDIYEGHWKAGKKDGKGTQTLVNGDVYEGDWKDNKQHGRGTQTLSNGDKYVGDFEADKRNGKGLLTSKNKDTYNGSWVDNKKHGSGSYTWSNKDKYIGDWKNNEKHGSGALVYANGRQNIGRFENDEYQDPKVLAVRLKLASTQMAKHANQLRDIKLGKGFVNEEGQYITILDPNEYNSTETISWEKAHPAIKFIATDPGINRDGIGSRGLFSLFAMTRWIDAVSEAEKITKCSYKAKQKLPSSYHASLGKVEKTYIDFNKINWKTKDFDYESNTYYFKCKDSCLSVFGASFGDDKIGWRSSDNISFTFDNSNNLLSRGQRALSDIEDMCSASSSDY
jgi:hypothetical protein